jgi:hypothetical protein
LGRERRDKKKRKIEIRYYFYNTRKNTRKNIKKRHKDASE